MLRTRRSGVVWREPCLHPTPRSGELTCTVVPAEGAGGTPPAVRLSSLPLHLVKELAEGMSGHLPGGPVHTRELSVLW